MALEPGPRHPEDFSHQHSTAQLHRYLHPKPAQHQCCAALPQCPGEVTFLQNAKDNHGFVCKGRNFNLEDGIDNIVYAKQLFVFFSGICPASESGGDCRNVDCVLNNSTASGPDQLPAWKSTPPPCRCAGLPGDQLIHISPYLRGEDHSCIQEEGHGWLAHQLPRAA